MWKNNNEKNICFKKAITYLKILTTSASFNSGSDLRVSVATTSTAASSTTSSSLISSSCGSSPEKILGKIGLLFYDGPPPFGAQTERDIGKRFCI
jgi:hypothetical protein